LFGIGFALLVSLFADYMGHIRTHEMWTTLSNAAFLVALAEFVFLMVYYVINLSQQIEGYRKNLDKYR
jgi:cell shape-determining protein MreD